MFLTCITAGFRLLQHLHLLSSSFCRIYGQDRIKFVERLVVSDLKELEPHKGQLSCFVNDKGGIIDDCMIYKMEDHLWIVSNASRAQVIDHVLTRASKTQQMNVAFQCDSLDEPKKQCLVALQGPAAEKVMRAMLPASLWDHGSWSFGMGKRALYKDKECYISRTGYTGEDGFEVGIIQRHIYIYLCIYISSIRCYSCLDMSSHGRQCSRDLL